MSNRSGIRFIRSSTSTIRCSLYFTSVVLPLGYFEGMDIISKTSQALSVSLSLPFIIYLFLINKNKFNERERRKNKHIEFARDSMCPPPHSSN